MYVKHGLDIVQAAGIEPHSSISAFFRLTISCLFGNFTGDTLLVGTRQGHLLVYSVRPTVGRTDARFDVTLDRFHRAFAKKAITQLAVVPEYHILISMSGKT